MWFISVWSLKPKSEVWLLTGFMLGQSTLISYHTDRGKWLYLFCHGCKCFGCNFSIFWGLSHKVSAFKPLMEVNAIVEITHTSDIPRFSDAPCLYVKLDAVKKSRIKNHLGSVTKVSRRNAYTSMQGGWNIVWKVTTFLEFLKFIHLFLGAQATWPLWLQWLRWNYPLMGAQILKNLP